MGGLSRTLPDIESGLETYRKSYLFARQTYLINDAIIMLEAMNQLLPEKYKIKELTAGNMVKQLDDSKIQCPKCKATTVLQYDDFQDLPEIDRMGSKWMRSKPTTRTYAEKRKYNTELWVWLNEYNLKLENQIGSYRYKAINEFE